MMRWLNGILSALNDTGPSAPSGQGVADDVGLARERLIRRGLILHNRDHEKAIAFADAHMRLMAATKPRAAGAGPTAAQRLP